MEFKKSEYYDEKFLGKYLYKIIDDNDKIFTVQEYFDINNNQKEYLKVGITTIEDPYRYKLKVFDNYYELDCKNYEKYLYLIFDKSVRITGVCCVGIIAPEIIIGNCDNSQLYFCVSDKMIINNKVKNYSYYNIKMAKINSINFYNDEVLLSYAEINNFFIFDKKFKINKFSAFLDGLKIKFFGKSNNLKEKMLDNGYFRNGIIHIE